MTASQTLDIRAELAAVMAAISHSRQAQSAISQQISTTHDIEQLGQLHDQWSEATEQLALAQQRRTELIAALDQ